MSAPPPEGPAPLDPLAQAHRQTLMYAADLAQVHRRLRQDEGRLARLEDRLRDVSAVRGVLRSLVQLDVDRRTPSASVLLDQLDGLTAP